MSTTDRGGERGVKLYRPINVRKKLTALQDYFSPEMEESEHGKYVLATSYDSLAAERDRLVEALRDCVEHLEWSNETAQQAYVRASNLLAALSGGRHG